MIAKKQPPPGDAKSEPPGHAAQTRKVDAMSELVAGLLLEDETTAPNVLAPSPSPSPASAVRPTGRLPSSHPMEERQAPRRPRILRAVVIGLLITLAFFSATAALLVLSHALP